MVGAEVEVNTMEQMTAGLGSEIGDVLGEGAEVFHIYTKILGRRYEAPVERLQQRRLRS